MFGYTIKYRMFVEKFGRGMIKEVTMYSAFCDGCGDVFEMWGDFTSHPIKLEIRQELVEKENDWSLLKDGKCYCPDCHFTELDGEGNWLAFTIGGHSSGSRFLGEVETGESDYA